MPKWQGSCSQHGAHLGPTGPRWTPCWPHEPCCLGCFSNWSSISIFKFKVRDNFYITEIHTTWLIKRVILVPKWVCGGDLLWRHLLRQSKLGHNGCLCFLTLNLWVSFTGRLTCTFHKCRAYTPKINEMHRDMCYNKADLRDLKAATGVQSGNLQFGSKSVMFCPVWPWNLMDDFGKQ